MEVPRSRVSRLGLLAVLALPMVVSGCASESRAPRRWYEEPGFSPDQKNVVQRPVYNTPPNGKPVFLGGYAGASY